jgi:hypothetical protein
MLKLSLYTVYHAYTSKSPVKNTIKRTNPLQPCVTTWREKTKLPAGNLSGKQLIGTGETGSKRVGRMDYWQKCLFVRLKIRLPIAGLLTSPKINFKSPKTGNF